MRNAVFPVAFGGHKKHRQGGGLPDELSAVAKLPSRRSSKVYTVAHCSLAAEHGRRPDERVAKLTVCRFCFVYRIRPQHDGKTPAFEGVLLFRNVY